MTDKKKLFLIINRLVLGGQSADAVSLAHHLSDKYNITILYGEKEADEKEAFFFIQQYPELTFIKIPSLRRAILPLQDAISYRQLLSIIIKHRPEIVHTHGFKSGLLGRIAAKKAGVPVIIHTYHGHLFHSYYNRFISSVIIRIERWLATISTRITAISPYQAYELNTTYRIAPAEKIETIYIGISKDNYELSPASATSLRKNYNIPDGTIVIAIIGRLVTIKNHSFFINVMQKLREQEANICFFIIGDGYSKIPMQKEMNRKGLTWQEGIQRNKNTCIYFTSWITDMAAALNDIDIVALTSLNEGTPVSLIEAQLFGKPVVATNVGGVRDTVINNETGFLIDGFNMDIFVKKLQLLIHNKELRTEMGEKGKAFVQQRFSKQKEVAAIDKLYTNCLTLKYNKSL